MCFAWCSSLSKDSTDVVYLVPKSQLCHRFHYVTFPDLNFLSCKMSVGWARTSPGISSSSEPSGAQIKMDATFSQPSPGGHLCQEVAPLIHVSSIDEGKLLVNHPSALKRILNPCLLHSCL